MAKTKISEFSSTAASNTDIDGINIAEGCSPSGINDAIRELMSQLKDWQSGTSNDPYVIGSSGSLTLNQGTANGVLYLNGSKVAISGSALTFDGTNLSTSNGATIQGLTVGKGAGAVSTNTALGLSALASNTTGANATAVGYLAANANTSGANVSAFGLYALKVNTTGDNNSAFGVQALSANTTGANNSAFGLGALYANTTASSNTAVGYQSAYSNTTGANNTAVGYQALYANTADWNTAVGKNAGSANTTGTQCVFIGGLAGYNNTTGNITAVGYAALLANTTGTNNVAIGGNNNVGVAAALQSNTTGSNNTAIGNGSLQSNTTASNNTAVGYQAGYAITTGFQNAIFGRQAGVSATTVSYNTFIGDYAGNSTTGGSNTFVGIGAGYLVTSGTKNTILGAYSGNQGGLDIRTASSYIVLSDGDGNPRGYFDNNGVFNVGLGGTSSSSEGNINLRGASGDGLGPQINGLSNGTTTWRISGYGRQNGGTSTYLTCANQAGYGVYLNGATATSWSAASDENRKDIIEPISGAIAKVSSLRTVIGKYKTEAIGARHPFLIAQDVQAVLPEAVGVMQDKDGEFLSVAYTDVIPLLTAAIKEQQTIIESLKARLDAANL